MKLRQVSLIAWSFVLALGTLGWFASPAMAQTGQASVTGTVRDASHALVTGASVVITNSETNVATRAQTNAEGIYYLGALPRGPYMLIVEKDGFKKWEGKLELYVGQNAVVDPVLNVGSVQEVVAVTDVAPVITTQSAEISNVKDYERIRQLPLNGREVTLLLNLTPGRWTGSQKSIALAAGPQGYSRDSTRCRSSASRPPARMLDTHAPRRLRSQPAAARTRFMGASLKLIAITPVACAFAGARTSRIQSPVPSSLDSLFGMNTVRQLEDHSTFRACMTGARRASGLWPSKG